MEEMSLAEISREISRLEKKIDGEHSRLDRRFNDYVRMDIYASNTVTIKEDVNEIKESQKWAMRLIVTQFIALVIGLVLLLAGRL